MLMHYFQTERAHKTTIKRTKSKTLREYIYSTRQLRALGVSSNVMKSKVVYSHMPVLINESCLSFCYMSFTVSIYFSVSCSTYFI